MKTYSKSLHEWDFVWRKIGYANSKRFGCDSVSATQSCVCLTVHYSIGDSGDRQAQYSGED